MDEKGFLGVGHATRDAATGQRRNRAARISPARPTAT
jgi:hypothetical protein